MNRRLLIIHFLFFQGGLDIKPAREGKNMAGKDDHASNLHQAFKEIVEFRRSYKRSFSSEIVDPAVIEASIALARWAPSAHNAQPWRFMIFYLQDDDQQALRVKILDAMEEQYKADVLGNDQATAARSGKASNDRLRQAPVLVLVLLDASVLDAYPDEPRRQAERVMGEQSVAACLQTFLLALHVAGLNACWMCAPLFAQATIQDMLQLPGALIPQAFVTAGYGDKTLDLGASRKDDRAPGSTRKPVSEILVSPFAFLIPAGDDQP